LNIKCLLIIFCVLLAPTSAFAWQHGISVGYGYGREIEQNYHNYGGLLNAKIYKFRDIDEKLIATIDINWVEIFSDTHDHNHMSVLAIPFAFRAYFFNPRCYCVRPYMEVSFGPSYISARQLGYCQQSKNFCFESNLVTGTEIGNCHRAWDINLRLMHFCNAGLFLNNQGFDLAPVLSIGYLF
jgi:hypothetical protein